MVMTTPSPPAQDQGVRPGEPAASREASPGGAAEEPSRAASAPVGRKSGGTPEADREPSHPPGPLPWYHAIRAASPAGRRWAEHLAARGALDFPQRAEEALASLRAGQVRRGRARLARLGSELESLRGKVEDSALRALERWYLGIRAYQRYLEGDLEGAEAELGAAEASVVGAVRAHRFLLPLAIFCHDFRVQRARIARSRRRWAEMEGHVRIARDMLEDRLPLCRLGDGEPVFVATLARHLRALPDLPEHERRALTGFLNPERRRRTLEAFTRSAYRLPWLLIQRSEPIP